MRRSITHSHAARHDGAGRGTASGRGAVLARETSPALFVGDLVGDFAAHRPSGYEGVLDELDAAPDTRPPEGRPTEAWPPADVVWLPEAYYNAALWETT